MKTRKMTWQGIFFLALTVLILPGCATLDKAALSELQRVPFEPLALQPSFDVYEIRLDLIREKDTPMLSDSTGTEEELSYRTLGFYLGNGLFFDLNNNLSLLIPDLFQVDPAASFTIKEFDRPNFREVVYRREPDTYIVEYPGLINWVRTANLLVTDTSLTFERGFLQKYSISWTDSTIRHKGLIFSTRILPEPGGYYVPALFLRRHFSQNGNVIELDREYRIVEENNAILLFRRNLIGRDKLLFTMVRSHSEWFIYNKRQRGFRLLFQGNELIVYENKREIKRYQLQ